MTKLKRAKDITVGAVLGGMLFSGVSYAASATSINVNFLPLKYFFDGIEKKAPQDQQGFIYQGTTYVPLRFASEALGKKVSYEGKTASVYVGKQPEGQKTFLDDLKPFSTTGDSSFDSSNDFKTNTGVEFTHSLQGRYYGTRYTMSQEFLLDGYYSSFEAYLAPDEYWSNNLDDKIGSLKIYADDKLIYESGIIASNITTPVKVNVDVKGVLKVKIEFSSARLGLLDAGFTS